MTKMRPETPKVTVLISTFNRPAYLREAIASVIGQSMPDWELLVMNDGGVDVRGIVEAFGDRRTRYFHDAANRGLAHRLNFGLEQARGRYIAYLGDDDRYYPNHLDVLSRELDEHRHCGAVYSDLYAVAFVEDDTTGRRLVLDKFIQVSRDFNRDLLFGFNFILHVSLMHRRDLAFKAGGYDEAVRVMIDWNMMRKLAFFTDFKHIAVPTGEYFMSITDSDRISVRERRDGDGFKHNLRRIKADLPPRPWLQVQTVAMVWPVARWTPAAVSQAAALIDEICYPLHYVIVNNDPTLDGNDCRRMLGQIADLGNVTIETPPKPLSELDAYRFGARKYDAEFVYLATADTNPRVKGRIISAVHAWPRPGADALKWDVAAEKSGPFDLFMKRSRFLRASASPKRRLNITAALMPPYPPAAYRCDLLLMSAQQELAGGRHQSAYRKIKQAEHIRQGGASDAFRVDLQAKICIMSGRYQEAETLCRTLIGRGYGADNWIRLAQALQRQGKFRDAVAAYQKGLKEIDLNEEDLMREPFPITVGCELASFSAFIGRGECLLADGDAAAAARMFRLASKLKANSHRSFLGFGKLFLHTGEFEQAYTALLAAYRLAPRDVEVLRTIGALFERQNKFEDACRAYRNALRTDGGDELSLARLEALSSRFNHKEAFDAVPMGLTERQHPGSTATARQST